MKRSDCKIVCCKTHTIQERYHLDKHYFHVGCGPCFPRLDEVFASLSLFVGVRQLALTLEDNNFSEPAQMIYALGKYDADLVYCQLDEDTGKIIDVPVLKIFI
jgi:hypothetical protein